MNARKDERLRALIDGQRLTARAAARELGIPYHIVVKACKALGIALYKGKRSYHPDNAYWRARARAKLSIDDAAERIGVGRQTVLLWETGKHMPKSVRTLFRIAEAYGVTVDDLLCAGAQAEKEEGA